LEESLCVDDHFVGWGMLLTRERLMRRSNSFALFTLIFLLSRPLVAAANVFDGHVIEYQVLYPTKTPPFPHIENILVGSDIEIMAIGETEFCCSLDISNTNLYFDFTYETFFIPYEFNGFRIADVSDNIPSFTAVDINPETNLAGFTHSRITFDADTIWLNFSGLHFTPDNIVSLDVRAIPEPTTISLLGLGLGLLWIRSRLIDRTGCVLKRCKD